MANKFRIVRETNDPSFYLELIDVVDREQRDEYNMEVEVEDGGTPKRFARVLFVKEIKCFTGMALASCG